MTAKALKVTKVASTWGWMAASRTPERAARFRLLTQRVAGALTLSLGGGGAYIAYQHSERVPVSGRTRLLLTSREEEIFMADCVAEQVTSDVPRKQILLSMDLDGDPPPPLEGRLFGLNYRGVTFFSRDRRDVMKHTVLTAAQRIVRAVRQSTDLPAGCDKLHWRLTVIDDPDTVNAFVLPNGHMFVYTGVLRDAPSQDCLAFLLGHECAHAALRHGGEKLSKQPALEMMGLLLTTLLAAVLPIGDGGFTLFQAACLKLGLSMAEVPCELSLPSPNPNPNPNANPSPNPNPEPNPNPNLNPNPNPNRNPNPKA